MPRQQPTRHRAVKPAQPTPLVDAILIGGGIMSATLGSMLALLDPGLEIVVLERSHALATESTDPWNNAGTGHSGYCELNYMPDPDDGSKPTTIAAQFRLSRQWWSHLTASGLLEPEGFIHTTPHVTVVFGEHDVEYLRRRHTTLVNESDFTAMEFTDDPEVIARWAPLVMEGRSLHEPVAATRVREGTDVDFGSLTKQLGAIIAAAGGEIRLGHEVRRVRREPDGTWSIRGRNMHGDFHIRSRKVFVGAGGYSLRLLQRARVEEVHGYAVLPVGAAFLRCSRPRVVDRHNAKVYGQAELGAPPMSVPHLDRRVVDGADHLMFGPYATFSTKLLKHGRWSDFFTTMRWHNIAVILTAIATNVGLIRYLIGQLAARPGRKFAQLKRFYPQAEPSDWEFIAAGQRAQLITPDRRRIGVIQQGTELVVSSDSSIAGLLGASPGASTAVPIMIDCLRRCFPDEWSTSWRATMSSWLPALSAIDDDR